MILFIVLIVMCILVLMDMEQGKTKSNYDYKCFLLTMKDQKERYERFIKSHKEDIPLEIIYGPDTRTVKIASEYEDQIDPEYYEKALEIHYNPLVKRPDITYFNMGAIGCFFGHMDFYQRCFDQGLKYAVIFEDNVIIKSNDVYDQIQSVIDEKGNDFEMCFFHCLSRLPDRKEGTLEKVNWISSTKCYLINVENMKEYKRYFLPMDNHIDMKHEDIIAQGARVYYKDLREYILIDRTHKSLIGHSDHGNRNFFSRQFPDKTPHELKWGY
jgi:GR25 family glycosyltransferase involved in LPS biosynthesis